MSSSKRVDQIAGHLNYPKGLLAGHVAIITGSGQGIGAEAARLFAREGAKVVVSDVDGGEFVHRLPQLRLADEGSNSKGIRRRKGDQWLWR